MENNSNPKLTPLAKELRRNMTEAERKLWYQFLKQLPVTVNRQKVMGNYIVDFYCHSAKLVVELDGSQHYDEEAERYDERRTDYLNDLGLKVLRFTNMDIDRHFESVCMVIMKEAGEM